MDPVDDDDSDDDGNDGDFVAYESLPRVAGPFVTEIRRRVGRVMVSADDDPQFFRGIDCDHVSSCAADLMG